MRKEYLIAILIVSLIALASSMSYDDAIAEDEHYKDMMCAGAWPPTHEHPASECKLPPVRSDIY